MLDFNSDAIFVFPRVDLHNKILISSQNSDLEKSASSTARPKFQRPRGRPRRVLSSSKSVCDLPIGSHSCDNRRRGIWKGFRIRAHPSIVFKNYPKKVSLTFHTFFNDCRIPQNAQFFKEKNILETEINDFLYFALVIVVEK